MSSTNPFDFADLNDVYEARHIVEWYATLSESLKQRCVDTIVDDQRMLAFLRQATAHAQHSNDFDNDVIIDLTRRMLEKIRQ